MPKKLKELDISTLKSWLDCDDVVLIDVRERGEHASEHIAQARLAPLSEFGSVDLGDCKGRKGVFFCASGMRTRMAAAQFAATGFDEVYILRGGIQAWKRAGLSVERGGGAAGRGGMKGRFPFVLGAIALLGLAAMWQY